MAEKILPPKNSPTATTAGAPAASAVSAAAGKADAKKDAKAEPVFTEAQLSKEFKEYSVAEFFKRNRQMLGYSGKVRSLTTIVHEIVTNSLDACEEAEILPDIYVEIQELEGGHIKVIAEDNGTGVPKKNVGQAFGQLLAGTKFHQRKQKRGQQGIGVSYAVLFSQITTGKTAHVKSGLGDHKVYECDLSIDVKKNEPLISNERETSQKFRGVRIEFEFAEVSYNRSEYSVYEYLRRTALANPHAQITLVEPNKNIIVFPRASKEIPQRPQAVLPHPLGITTSDLIEMAHASKSRKISSFLTTEFSRFSNDKVKEINAICPDINFDRAPSALTWPEAEKIINTIQKLKWIAPETDALRPIGREQIEKSLKNLLQPEQMKATERKPKVFRGGIPFMVEAAIAYGGKAGAGYEESEEEEGGRRKTKKVEAKTVEEEKEALADNSTKSELLRFANRTPLLFDAGNCAITEAVKSIEWSRYGLKNFESQPISIYVNFVSVYVPYTGAGKLAINSEEEIVEEIRYALMECARDIGIYLNSLQKAEDQERRRTIFVRYTGEVAQSLHEITGKPQAELLHKLQEIAKERTILLEAKENDGGEEALEDIEATEEKEIEEEGEGAD